MTKYYIRSRRKPLFQVSKEKYEEYKESIKEIIPYGTNETLTQKYFDGF